MHAELLTCHNYFWDALKFPFVGSITDPVMYILGKPQKSRSVEIGTFQTLLFPFPNMSQHELHSAHLPLKQILPALPCQLSRGQNPFSVHRCN